jgi:hypothetical protein
MHWNRILAVVFVLSSTQAFSQSPGTDSLPFRKGQWAAQFTASSDHRNAGIIRFRSPSSAWILTAAVAATTGGGDGQASVPYDTTLRRTDNDIETIGFSGRAGRRRYRSLTRQAVSFTSAGLLGGVARGHRTDSGGGYDQKTRTMQWNAGLFGELGAAFLIVPNVSLGVIGSVDARFSRSRVTDIHTQNEFRYTNSTNSDSFNVSTEILSAVLTVYF